MRPESSSVDGIERRKTTVLLVLSGVFFASLAMMNILGISRFIDLSFSIPGTSWRIPMPLAIGVLPYPITFLCTDLISEFYGRKTASTVVWVGLGLNAWVVGVLWLGGVLPGLGDASSVSEQAFFEIRRLTFGAVTASMAAYLAAQFVDVELFHFWRRVTRGRHLWLRNNASTLVSQFVDAVAVIGVTHFYAGALPVDPSRPVWPQLLTFIGASYVFKALVALIDTLPFYGLVHVLHRFRIGQVPSA